MKKKPKYPFWLQEIIDAGEAGLISPEDVQKCVDGLEDAKAISTYIEGSKKNPLTLMRVMPWHKHSYGGVFWSKIDDKLTLYRKKNSTNEKEI